MGDLTQLTTLLPQTIQTIKDKREEVPICEECSQSLSQVISQGKLIWRCYGTKCKKKREEVRKQSWLKEKQDHPERFMINFNIPQKHLSRSLDNFGKNTKVVKMCRKYSLEPINSLFFTGVCGCGKTHLAVAILREMVKANTVERAYFITAPELLLEIRRSFQDSADTNEGEIIEYYATMPFLILDDLGAEKVSEWAVTTLYLIVDRRNREERPTIFTSNLGLDEIEQKLNARIASRLADCRVIQLDMPDYRKMRK